MVLISYRTFHTHYQSVNQRFLVGGVKLHTCHKILLTHSELRSVKDN